MCTYEHALIKDHGQLALVGIRLVRFQSKQPRAREMVSLQASWVCLKLNLFKNNIEGKEAP